jgi:hypothetical protein
LKATRRCLSRGGKRFNWLTKMIEKGGAAKSDIRHIERSGAHPGFQIGLRPTQVTSGVWVFAALILRNPSQVGPLAPTCKIGISP